VDTIASKMDTDKSFSDAHRLRRACGFDDLGARSRASVVTPNVRAKVAPTVWRAGTAAQNGPRAPRRRPSVPRRWGSA
jgi:hypothetical protein